jgi:hypothetical protein
MTSRSFHRICFILRLLPLSNVITRDIFASMGRRKVEGARPGGNRQAIFRALVESFRFGISLWGYATASSSKGDDVRTESG